VRNLIAASFIGTTLALIFWQLVEWVNDRV